MRSARAETEIPTQVQLSDDSEFLNLLGNTSVTRQDLDVSSNSDSDLDLSAVVGGSDSDDVSTQGLSFDCLQVETLYSVLLLQCRIRLLLISKS